MKSTAVLLLVGGLALVGCSTNSRGGAERSVTSSDIERTVKAKFATDPSIPPGIDVSADASKNEITLSGTVPSETVRNKAVELAKASSPGAVVVDKIDVKPQEVARADYNEDMAKADREKAKALGDSIGNSADDAYIHSRIVSKLLGNAETPAAKIHVDVKDGVVTLRGEVDSPNQKAEAERLAKSVDGVKRVNDRLKVKA